MSTLHTPVAVSDADVVSGAPVFARTRVTFQTLLDDIAAGEPLAEFLGDVPTVSREQAIVISGGDANGNE